MFVQVRSGDRVYLASDELSFLLDGYFEQKSKHFEGWVKEGKRFAPVRSLVLNPSGRPIGWEFIGKPADSRLIRYDRGAWFPRKNKTVAVQSLLSALSADSFPKQILFEVVFPQPKNTKVLLEKVLVNGEEETRDPDVRAFRSGKGGRWFVAIPGWLDEVPDHLGNSFPPERIFDHVSFVPGLHVSMQMEIDSRNCLVRS